MSCGTFFFNVFRLGWRTVLLCQFHDVLKLAYSQRGAKCTDLKEQEGARENVWRNEREMWMVDRIEIEKKKMSQRKIEEREKKMKGGGIRERKRGKRWTNWRRKYGLF